MSQTELSESGHIHNSVRKVWLDQPEGKDSIHIMQSSFLGFEIQNLQKPTYLSLSSSSDRMVWRKTRGKGCFSPSKKGQGRNSTSENHCWLQLQTLTQFFFPEVLSSVSSVSGILCLGVRTELLPQTTINEAEGFPFYFLYPSLTLPTEVAG